MCLCLLQKATFFSSSYTSTCKLLSKFIKCFLIKHISQVEQSNIECKEDITEQEKIDKEQRRQDEMELLEESIEILKIYKLLQQIKNKRVFQLYNCFIYP